MNGIPLPTFASLTVSENSDCVGATQPEALSACAPLARGVPLDVAFGDTALPSGVTQYLESGALTVEGSFQVTYFE
jgi:hypothetical protein